jgi:hypothetical protein
MTVLNFTGYNLPASTEQALRMYVDEGYRPGGFLCAVLNNNLFRAVSQADTENRAALADIVKFIYNRCPQRCHGDTYDSDKYVDRVDEYCHFVRGEERA